MQRAYCKEALGLSELIDELMTFTPEAPRPVANGEEPRDDDPMAWQKRFGAAEASLAKSEVKEAVQQHVNASRPRATELQAWLNSLDGDARAAFLHCAPTRWNKLLFNGLYLKRLSANKHLQLAARHGDPGFVGGEWFGHHNGLAVLGAVEL